jgi:thiosulfate dehydrogenase
MATRIPHALTIVVPVAAALGACDRIGARKKEVATTTVSAAKSSASRPRVALRVPGDDTIPPGPEGDLVRRGRRLATRTSEELPSIVGADMHCTSCHLEAATRANAGPWVGIASLYPAYRDRAGRDITLEERIDECFERSMNGKALPHDSPEMKAFIAYIGWLSRDVPPGAEVEGRGFPKIERPPVIDVDSGERSYIARCASCHGVDGEGRRAADGSYQFPPLWGDRSFNIGAGMARLDTAASFVRHNMPLGRPEPLTARESYEIALYFTERSRADLPGKSADWPHGGKPADARY